MRPTCISCHNTHPQSPKTDWQAGDVRGVLEIILPLDTAEAQTREGLGITAALLVILSIIGLSGLTLVIGALRRRSRQALELADTIKHTNEKLEERVRQRTEALAAANEKLEAKNAELERFTYAVSHDLKAPLFTIQGFLGLVEKNIARGNTERVAVHIEQINAATENMERLLAELLELSRIGYLAAPREEIALTGLAREAVALVTGRIKKRGVTVDIDPGLPTITGDRARLLQVFQNLIDNAVKFMGDQPAPHIEIGSTRRDEETVCFIKDNGLGIEARHHEGVFGLFRRLDARGEGTGIGLAMVKRIVEVHGGRIWVESEGKGHGSTFYFTLPGFGLQEAG